MLLRAAVVVLLSVAAAAQSRAHDLVLAARAQIAITTGYDGRYVRIAYPGGDVERTTGVCTDVLIRAFRRLGIDWQKDVHEDMRAHFHAYPQRWSLAAPDRNIDHRRVPNLMTFLGRKGKAKPISSKPADYLPGDIVAWDLGRGVSHIGIVSDEKVFLQDRYKIVHNIGRGVQEEDVLFRFKIIGHYWYF